MKFAELLVYNEGARVPASAAYEAGYKTRPRQAAASCETQNISIGCQYIGELRAEVQRKIWHNF